MARLAGKVGLITGAAATTGLGWATAALLAREGARMVLSDIGQPDGERAAEAIAAEGGAARYLDLDVTVEADWERAVDSILETEGRLDILVNNAGIAGASVPVAEMDLQVWRRCIEVCLDGVFLGVKHGIGAMRRNDGGSIVNISSIAGKIGIPTSGNYCAAKGGVALLTKAAALECAGEQPLVRVNSVHPGFIETDLLRGVIQRRGRWFSELIDSTVPMGRLGAPTDIAEAILYLASDASRFVTGSELVVDGGYLAR